MVKSFATVGLYLSGWLMKWKQSVKEKVHKLTIKVVHKYCTLISFYLWNESLLYFLASKKAKTMEKESRNFDHKKLETDCS